MRSNEARILFLTALMTIVSCTAVVAYQDSDSKLPDSWNEAVRFRSVGPANMMGRITSIAVYPGDKNIWWAASASGGLLKTTSNGTKFEHQFDKQATVSIGDVQVAATDPDLVWVGTGEANPRNSVSWGDGVYKSTDGGKTWKNMGLKKTFQTGRIAIHPENHDIVYVGSLGRLWGPNPERGLFKTTDGGKNWEKVFYVDDKTGVVDVQMNPENPDELIIATYERLRDGFDSNDPAKKYGEGSGIYKSVDAGKTFTRLSNGLPTCKLGRIGLTYFAKDPNFIAAIVESEKIATEPKTAAYAGLRGENADVGAKITQVTEDGPADKAGLKENDIVVSANGVVLYSYADLLSEIRKHKSGETVELVVSRERKPIDVVVELGTRPERRPNRRNRGARRTPFTGTLGGQAANLQGQQGDNEEEYGGIYLSKNGGDSWERINTLNPRPMYYSQIRIDPVDMNNMYVLGTSLYKSKDAGSTFTGDGGGRAVHVDHHALWIDPEDPRHMILGNDGGIYVTHDRMENWDHLNHAAIGQFYHVGVGSRDNYRVYGGLQDNGSWGGPVRSGNDSGTINSDWFRVGGGDGFITLPDPDDPDQIYFESQNGAMGRIHLETGDRGFIRPRPPRGTRYRFNWKTPFLLSPHNSRIHYSAGNHVFRSYNKGTNVASISPDITNTDKGAGSAITESPVKAGVLYVGTTDGAVWMTKDGGNEWIALYSQKEEKQKDKPKNRQEAGQADEKNKDSAEAQAAEAANTGTAKDKDKETDKKVTNKLDGVWNGTMISDRFPEGQEPTITLSLKANDNGEVSGEVETRRGPQKISSGKYDASTGELNFAIETQRGKREFSASVKEDTMVGEMSMRNGQFQVEFEAKKQEDPGDGKSLLVSLPLPLAATAMNIVSYQQDDDPVTGQWDGMVRIEGGPEIKVTLSLELDKENGIKGLIETDRGEIDIDDGQYSPKTGKVYFSGENERVYLDFEGNIKGNKLTGDVSINDSMTAGFEATMSKSKESKPAEQEEPAPSTNPDTETDQSNVDPSKSGYLGVRLQGMAVSSVVPDSPASKAGLQKDDVLVSIDEVTLENPSEVVEYLRSRKAGETINLVAKRDGDDIEIELVLGARPQQAQQAQPAVTSDQENSDTETKPDEIETSDSAPQTSEEKETEPASDDQVSGTWKGTITTQQGDSDISLKLVRGKTITGTYETERSEGEIVEGKLDEASQTLTLVAENERFNLEFDGKLSGSKYEGEIDFNGGMFTVEFDMKKTSDSKASVAANEEAKPSAKSGKPLSELLPGPRWVSSLEASKYKAERCYISFDGHRSNDTLPHIFVTEDYGKSWNSIRGNLPDEAGSVRVIREDRTSENILYLGCEFGAWVSIDRGTTWTKFKNVPTVAVHEIAQHPRLDDIVLATHGRSIWVGDVATLRQLDGELKTRELFEPRDVIIWQSKPRRGSSGTRKFVAANPPIECRLEYYLADNERALEIEIRNLRGDVVKRFDEPPRTKGINSVSWDLRRASNGGRFGRRVDAGQYLVDMRVGAERIIRTIDIKNDPQSPQRGSNIADEFTWWMYIGGLADKID